MSQRIWGQCFRQCVAVLSGLTNLEQPVITDKYKDAAVLKKIHQGVWEQSVD